ncbi:MAG TPA: septum formation initiator family protein [bacterium]|nr:septum formation initiator family protein [bacterium]
MRRRARAGRGRGSGAQRLSVGAHGQGRRGPSPTGGNQAPAGAVRGPGAGGRGDRLAAVPLRPRLLMIALGCLAGWMVIALGAQYLRAYTLAREAARLERHRQELRVENATLRAEITRLQTDDRYLERLAREQLGMLRPEEMELVIVPSAARDPGSPGKPRSGDGPAPPGRAIRDWAQGLRGVVERWLRRVVPGPFGALRGRMPH